MTRRQALILKVSVVWTVWVWLVLIRNMITTPGLALSFRAVHIGLAVVSLVFAGLTWGIVVSNRRKAVKLDVNQGSKDDTNSIEPAKPI